MITIDEPEFKDTNRFFKRLSKWDPEPLLHEYGRMGVSTLSAATPVDTGETANSWNYKVEGDKNRYKLIWTNSKMAGTAPLVLLLQYGHNTKSGYFISGRDFINPALYPVYDGLSEALMKDAVG